MQSPPASHSHPSGTPLLWQVRYKDDTPEEERATVIEAQIQRELGEPERKGYKDQKIPAVVVPGPTYNCRRETPACDTLIQNHPKDP